MSATCSDSLCTCASARAHTHTSTHTNTHTNEIIVSEASYKKARTHQGILDEVNRTEIPNLEQDDE